MEIWNYIFPPLISAIFGIGLGYYLRKLWAVRRKDSIEARVEGMVSEAKAKQKQILLEANDKALKVTEAAKTEIRQMQQEVLHSQKMLEKRQAIYDQKILEIESKDRQIHEKVEKINKIKDEINKIKEEEFAKLEKVASLTRDEAKNILIQRTEQEIKNDLDVRIKKLSAVSNEEIEKRAKEIIALAVQRCASSHAAEITTTSISIPTDEMKGRIIGKEGRNIRSIEQLTGVEIIIDDTPGTITVSGFSPIRRQVAKMALEKLILDGRIHPAKIEDAVETAKKELAIEIKKAGEDALYETGITGIDPKLVQILGRLKYRTSYGQNILQHSIEVTHLCVLLAQDLGANVSIAKQGGLFHDIGKAVDHEIKGGHTQIGYDILKKFNMPEEVAYICIGHHEDAPKTLEAIIVKTADAISGARPGARKDTYEKYLQRLDELEKVATSFPGVEKSYAIQAGRELRIFVVPEEIDDLEAHKLARDIAKKIEEQLHYPGEIKITLIRETRVIEYAR